MTDKELKKLAGNMRRACIKANARDCSNGRCGYKIYCKKIKDAPYLLTPKELFNTLKEAAV